MRIIAGLFLAGLVAGPAFAQADGPLAGTELRKLIAGNRVYLATPLGGEFPLNYRANGVVDGDGEASGLGRYMAPKDSGRWWIAGNQLCQKWSKWYDGKQYCFTIRETGANKIAWTRDDGLSGTGRVAP